MSRWLLSLRIGREDGPALRARAEVEADDITKVIESVTPATPEMVEFKEALEASDPEHVTELRLLVRRLG